MSWVTAPWHDVAVTAAKAAAMYVVALVALRVGERRTLAQLTIIDVVAAVAVGAVVGRTAIAQQPLVTGVVALATLVVVHRLASLLRFRPLLGKLADHRVRVLAVDGVVRRGQLRRSGLTDNDLFGELRLRGVFDLAELRYVLYETKGGFTLVPKDVPPAAPLVQHGLDAAVDRPARDSSDG